MKNNDKLKDLKIDEWIWGIFIFLSILNIFGDELEKDFYAKHHIKSDQTAKKIFTFTLFVSLLIYIYFLYQRYQQIQMAKARQEDPKICELRGVGSVLVVIASLLFLYCQLEDTRAHNPSIE